MGVETAFLLGVLVGQWIMFWAMWRNISRLEQKIKAWRADFHPQGSPESTTIELLPERSPDDDLF